jgi:two-component system invasion response regulator UvrY
MQSGTLSILIVDDSVLVRMGLKELIAQEFRKTVIGEARSGTDALALLSKRPWNLVILDISLPDRDAFSLLREVLTNNFGAQPNVLMLGMHADPFSSTRALQLGASGYVSLNSERRDLVEAINSLLVGKKFFQNSLPRGATSKSDALRANLSTREYEVLIALARGKQTGEIASELKLSNQTISTFKRRILNKLQLSSTAELVRYAIQRKLA